MTSKRIALVGALSAIALTIFMLEAQLPPIVPIPGVKLGLANAVTLVTMAVLGRKDAGFVLLVRVLLGSVFAGSISALMFSAAGGLLAFLVMALFVGRFSDGMLWVVSILAAVAHNIGQLTVAVWVSGTPGILVYAPALLAAGIGTGAFTGAVSVFLTRALCKTR
ncbi:MAG: Gx transporter family protein [Eubacteriales bacterium]|nr:Gx transporter family protein [Eubacteriales bacterium]